MMTGSGGWPLSLFLTPDGRPFYGGTYFPPTSRWGRPGFLQILAAIADGWKTRRDELETSAGEMLAHLEAGAAAALRAGADELPADAARRRGGRAARGSSTRSRAASAARRSFRRRCGWSC